MSAASRADHAYQDSAAAGFDAARSNMKWDAYESMLTALFGLRLLAVIGWGCAVAYSHASGWYAYATAAFVLSGVLPFLHSMRSFTLRWIGALHGGPQRFFAWLLPYPETPQLHPVGALDFLGCCVIGLGSGGVFHIVGQGTAHPSIAPGAYVLAVIAMLPGGIEMAAHVSWDLRKAARPWITQNISTPDSRTARALRRVTAWLSAGFRWIPPTVVRLGVAPVSAAFIWLTLWPSWRISHAPDELRGIAIAGATATVALCLAVIPWTAATNRAIDWRCEELRATVRYEDSRHAHALRNLARPILARGTRPMIPETIVQEIISLLAENLPAERAHQIAAHAQQAVARHLDRQAIQDRELAIAVSAFEDMLVHNNLSRYQGLRETLIGVSRAWTTESGYSVIAELDPDTLLPGDNETIALLVGDLAANAYCQQANAFTVGSFAEHHEIGSTIQVIATCTCANRITEIGNRGSMSIMQRRMRLQMGATYEVQEIDASGGQGLFTHRFTVTWRSASSPLPRAYQQVSQN